MTAQSEITPAAVTAMILAAANPAHDDGHTDTYYEGLIAAALPHLPVVAERNALREALAEAQDATILRVVAWLRAQRFDPEFVAEFEAHFTDPSSPKRLCESEKGR